MNLENALYYVTHHSESIIQWLFLAILLLAGTVIARALFGKKPEAQAAGAAVGAGLSGAGGPSEGSADIQTFLQKILEQTAKLESVSLNKMTPAEAGQVDVQVQALKTELASRDEEIIRIKSTGGGAGAGDAEKIANRIKELEAKLAEYEILEDDIADLSLYKEENARLKSELDKVKSAGPGAAAPADEEEAEPTAAAPAQAALAASAPAPAPEATPSAGDDIVAEFAEAVHQETTGGGSPMDIKPTGDSMADFENAMKLEKKMNPAPEVAAAEAPAAAPAPVPAVHAAFAAVNAPAAHSAESAAPTNEADDLFAEFATAAPDESEGSSDEQGGLDTDKMMEEMAALVNMPSEEGASALEDGIDTEKMALEATKLVK